MTISKTEIKQALSILKKGADFKNAQILSNALVTPDGLTVDNLTDRLTYSINTGVANPCTVAVPDLEALVPVDSKDTGAWDLAVKFDGLDKDEKPIYTMVAVCGDETLMLDASLPVEDFPQARPIDQVSTHDMNVADFLEALEYLLPAVSQDVTRPHINGVCFKDDLMVATDGHRLHWVPSGFTLAKGEQVLHRNTIVKIMAILKQVPTKQRRETLCHLTTVHEGTCQFVCGNWTLKTKVIDSPFPPYDQVIPKYSDYVTTINHRTLDVALKRVKKMTADRTLGVKLTTTPASLTLETDVPDRNKQCKLTVPATSTIEFGEEAEIGFNCEYLLTGIKWQGTESVTLNMNGTLDPLVVHIATQYPLSKVGAVVMPMRI